MRGSGGGRLNEPVARVEGHVVDGRGGREALAVEGGAGGGVAGS